METLAGRSYPIGYFVFDSLTVCSYFLFSFFLAILNWSSVPQIALVSNNPGGQEHTHTKNLCHELIYKCKQSNVPKRNHLWEVYRKVSCPATSAKTTDRWNSCIALEQFLDFFVLAFPWSIHDHGCSQISGICWPRCCYCMGVCEQLWFCNQNYFNEFESKLTSYFLHQFSTDIFPGCLYNHAVHHHYKPLIHDYAQTSKTWLRP